MEEGPEPQELMEQISQSSENRESLETKRQEEKRLVVRSAITASILAVGAAISSLLSGHAANDAIIKQTEATDKWCYFQAKSTKSHVFEGDKQVILTIASMIDKPNQLKTKESVEYFDRQIKGFDDEKVKIQDEAQKLEKESSDTFAKHQNFSLAVACFQIGIVLASVAILADANWLYTCSVGAGVIGILFTLLGVIKAA
jgi:hypothetical protein